MTQISPVSYWIFGIFGGRVGSGGLRQNCRVRVGGGGLTRSVSTGERVAPYWRVVAVCAIYTALSEVCLMAIIDSAGVMYVGRHENVAGLFGEIPIQIARLWQQKRQKGSKSKHWWKVQ